MKCGCSFKVYFSKKTPEPPSPSKHQIYSPSLAERRFIDAESPPIDIMSDTFSIGPPAYESRGAVGALSTFMSQESGLHTIEEVEPDATSPVFLGMND